MNYIIENLKRCTIDLLLYTFFITISYASAFKAINLPIDPIGNNSYLFNSNIPSIIENTKIYDIQVNGSLGLPYSTFIFDVEESPVKLNDSLRTRSTFHFKRGDYGYRDLAIKTQTLTLNKGILTAFAHSRSYEGVNIYLGGGSLIQNYLMNYDYKSRNTTVSLSAAYHNEGMNIPINTIQSLSKQNESYFYGTTLKKHFLFGNFNFQSNIQVSESMIDNTVSEYWMEHNNILFKFNGINKFIPHIGLTKNSYSTIMNYIGFDWQDSFNGLELNLFYINKFDFEINFYKKFKDIKIEFIRDAMVPYIDSNNTYILNSLFIGYSNSIHYLSMMPRIVESEDFSLSSFEFNTGINKNNVSFQISSQLYDLNKVTELNYVINSDLKFILPFYKRYSPFIDINYNYFYLDSDLFRNDQTDDLLNIYLDGLLKNVHRLNISFGIDLDSFNISYSLKNIFETGVLTKNYDVVPLHKILTIKWKFNN